MGETFQVGITCDFLDPTGRMTYKNIGLSLLDREPRCAYGFLEEHSTPVTPEQIAPFDAILSLTPAWTADTFARGAERLLIVARFGVGYDMCDIAALTANHVLLTITPGATDHPVAGGVLAMMLALSRRLFTKDRLVREGRWQERTHYMGTEIGGKVLGIVGFGGAGKRLSQLVAPFQMQVIAYDPLLPDPVFAAHGVRRAATLEQLFASSDYVSIHCPLNRETHHLIGRRLFHLMKPTAYFFNAARGPIVNEADLIDTLQSGRIAGAGIDVFEQEPPGPDHPLLAMENVILAPHAVCWTDECFQAIGESAVRSILTTLADATRDDAGGTGNMRRWSGASNVLLNPEVLEQPGFQQKQKALRARLQSGG